MIEKILEFHCIVLDCNDYEIVLRKDCNQKQNETNSKFRITEFSMTYYCKSRDIERKIAVITMPIRRQYLNGMTIIQI
ncbi:MAG: hypothetical protein EHM25_10345 [Nitrosopumilales archaeon]|jgi:hypothetical protein|nr:MAG: hypothetical protein EHM25_15185 [Nitrosopumilales archaeon]RPJ28181.1 MAG: hypothetical protein EHM25_10345 [Nitrosopumilales archaeon]